jgi:hypothetical protein
MLISILDVVKEPSRKPSQSYLKQPAVVSKSNSDYIFLFTTMCPSHTQTQRTTRMRMSDVQQDQTKVKGDLLFSSPMCRSRSNDPTCEVLYHRCRVKLIFYIPIAVGGPILLPRRAQEDSSGQSRHTILTFSQSGARQ